MKQLLRIEVFKRKVLQIISQAGFDGKEVICAAVNDYRPLTWYAPPIYPAMSLGNFVPSLFLSEGNLDVRRALAETYKEQLPKLLSGDIGIERLAARLRKSMNLTFPGFTLLSLPSDITQALPTLACEVAAFCYGSGNFTGGRDAESLYVINPDLSMVGILDGVIVGAEDLGPIVKGQLTYYTSMFRGRGWTTETLTVIDRLQFWYEENSLNHPMLELLGVMLPVLKEGLSFKQCLDYEAELMQLKAEPVKVELVPEMKEKAAFTLEHLNECLAVMHDIATPDIMKVDKLAAILVPRFVKEETFLTQWLRPRPNLTLKKSDIARICKKIERLQQSPTRKV